MIEPRPAAASWRTSSFSQQSGACVEVHRDLTALRDTKDPAGPRVRVDVAVLAAWVTRTAR